MLKTKNWSQKKILETAVILDEVTFRPEIGLGGFRVVSSFDVDKFNCQNLANPTYKLGVILYPPDTFNEKFLINIRDCMLHLSKKHPVKKWLSSLRQERKPGLKEQAEIDFLNEVLNSPFNLITDQNLKSAVIKVIKEVPDVTSYEKLLSSYLYLMIGNITKSDNILKKIISESPRAFYSRYDIKPSYFHLLAQNNLDKIISKMANHPADRLTFYLFTQYGRTYFNRQDLIKMLTENSLRQLGKKIFFSYTEAISPVLVGALRINEMPDEKRGPYEIEKKYSSKTKREWFWPFSDYPTSYNAQKIDGIFEAEKSDPLWTLYLINEEALADQYLKKGGRTIQQRRLFLRSNIENKNDFMLTLFKMIEMGDIDESLVEQVSHFLTNE